MAAKLSNPVHVSVRVVDISRATRTRQYDGVRMNRVLEIKALISSGRYQVSAATLADAMLRRVAFA